MTAFKDAYNQLNAAQKQAVDTIDGPLLVIAGPGTGKTQLLSARVANILQRTDTPASNILCLTFTESGAANMRERLTRFIGRTAYDVNIGTYHAFGGDLIKRYPEYFADTRLQNPIDELGKRQVILGLVEAMPYDNPLKQTRHHLGDLIGTLSEVKRALLTSSDLQALALENSKFIAEASKRLLPIFADFTRTPSSYAKAAPYFEQVMVALAGLVPPVPVSKHFEPLAVLCSTELASALETAAASNKTSVLTAWKNNWLVKDADNHFIIAGELENLRITALADVLDSYQVALAARGLYDFDDMIVRSIQALETNDDLRYTLQERYLYILLDEFQDTNAAQLRLVQLLTNNPLSEGRPNVLAVGDDDQAIYAFQGAQYSNMLEFYQMYRDTGVINLTENYRSHSDILETAHNIAEQIEGRLHQHFEGMTKTLTAANAGITKAHIERREFQSDIAERAWIATEIKHLIETGVRPSEIAVLAPKHKQLEPLVPYLNAHGVPVRYEKRENILDAPVIRQLITMSQLLLALQANNHSLANALWPQVLSYDFWQIPIDAIWRVSWQVSDSRDSTGGSTQKESWSEVILGHDSPQIRRAAEVLLGTAGNIGTDSCETILDYLIGSSLVETHSGPAVASPLRDYYTSATVQAADPELFYETLSHITVLRARLREFQDTADSALLLPDFVRFIEMYDEAEQPMINTSPYSQQADAVQLSTVFKAKGLEYEHVFLPNCLDDVWGSSSRGNSNKLTLPPNLQPIRHAGTTDDERLRILFVAVTRAKQGLHLSSALRAFSGKTTKRLKYLDEQEQPAGGFKALALPVKSQQVRSDDTDAPEIALLELDWRTRHIHGLVDVTLQNLLSDRADKYQISPTHMVSFVDLEYAGPQRFFFDSILRFPGAPSPDSQYGTAIHESLEWYQHQLSEHGYAPHTKDLLDYFTVRVKSKKLTEQRANIEILRGRKALTTYITERGKIFQPGDVAEKNFRSESVFCGDAHMAGKVDRLEIDSKNKTITVVDYKTGRSYNAWKSDSKLHKYQLQLYAYKILIEGSKTYAGYSVSKGRLEFIEPDSNGKIASLELTFQAAELERVKQLLQAVWKHVKSLEFPETTDYPASLAGIVAFEQSLIDSIHIER